MSAGGEVVAAAVAVARDVMVPRGVAARAPAAPGDVAEPRPSLNTGMPAVSKAVEGEAMGLLGDAAAELPASEESVPSLPLLCSADVARVGVAEEGVWGLGESDGRVRGGALVRRAGAFAAGADGLCSTSDACDAASASSSELPRCSSLSPSSTAMLAALFRLLSWHLHGTPCMCTDVHGMGSENVSTGWDLMICTLK